jgi:hypothetical protein
MKPKVITFITLIHSIGLSQNVPSFVSDVYNNIFNSMDNGHVIKPTLLLDLNHSQIVSFNPNNNEIKIGSEFIKVCRKFGKDSSNAIAHVLGHELAHILLQQHDFVKSVGSGYASKEINKQMKSIHKILKDSVFERQADEYASFYAHIAGYNTVQIGEFVLDSIYLHFKIKDKDLSQYPSLKERKLICKASASKMNVLKSVFDFANLATVAGNYDIAESCYQTIIKEKFPSREIFNNLSTVYLLKAIQEIDTVEFPYLFPVELDFESRLYSSERSIFSQYEENLLEAKRYAKLALGSNEDYAKAWLNKGIAEFLLNRKEDASYSFFKAKELNNSFINLNIEIMQALLEHKFGDKRKGIEELNEIENSNVAKLNIQKLSFESGKENKKLNKSLILSYLKDLKIPIMESYNLLNSKNDTLKNLLIYSKSLSLKEMKDNDFIYWDLSDISKKSKPKFILSEYRQFPIFEDLADLEQYPSYRLSDARQFYRIDAWILEIENEKIRKIFYVQN